MNINEGKSVIIPLSKTERNGSIRGYQVEVYKYLGVPISPFAAKNPATGRIKSEEDRETHQEEDLATMHQERLPVSPPF